MAARNGYLGRAPGDSSVVVARQVFNPSGVTTDFTFSSGYTVGYLDLYINGVRLIEGQDYTATDTSTINVLNGGAQNGDVLEAVAYKSFNLGQSGSVGVSSGGVTIGQAQTLNFIGAGNTFAYDSTSKTVDISIAGGGGGGLGTAINYESGEKTPFSYIDRTAQVTENMLLDTSNAGESDSIIISIIPNIEVNAGVALTVGAGKTMVIDALQIGDLRCQI